MPPSGPSSRQTFRRLTLSPSSQDSPSSELLAQSAHDVTALLELLDVWLKHPDASRRGLLLRATEFNDPNLVEFFLPAEPLEMWHAMLVARTNANDIYQDCDDFLVYRGTLLDEIRGYRKDPTQDYEIARSIVQLLRQAGAPDFTRLTTAARSGDLDSICRELAAGFPVNFTCDGWGSPLLAAITGGHRDAVKLLLEAGADPNLGFDPDLYEGPNSDIIHLPFAVAMKTGNPQLLNDLLKAGADLQLPIYANSSIFHRDSIPSREIAEILFNHLPPTWRDHLGNSCVHLLFEQALHLCQDLIPAEAWNSRNHYAETPAMLALIEDQPKLHRLLSCGASPNEYAATHPDHSNWFFAKHQLPSELKTIAITPLHAAIASGNRALVTKLIAVGGDTELPAFILAENPPEVALRQIRAVLREFHPAPFPSINTIPRLMGSAYGFMDIYHHCTDLEDPPLSIEERIILAHYLCEDPSRASAHPDLIISMTCTELAKLHHS